jgi:ubiquinone biosynthesis accessory factor UbiJ
MMLLTPLQALLNRNIAASAAARAACRRLADKTLALHVNASSDNTLFSIFVSCGNDKISLAARSDLPIAATLSGSPSAYLSMLRSTPEAVMRAGGVRIEGDAEVAQGFRDLLAAARPDVEEELARLVGDVAAHQLGNLARGALQFGRRVADTVTANISEYLTEESRDAVGRVEVDEFIRAVDKLRDDVDRAEAKLALLERQTKKN